jgi:hypothetical protein
MTVKNIIFDGADMLPYQISAGQLVYSDHMWKK